MKMSLNIYATIFLSLIAVVQFSAAGPISHSKRRLVEDGAEEKNFVANIVKDILSKVAHAGAHRAALHNDTDASTTKERAEDAAVPAKNTTEQEEEEEKDSLATVFDDAQSVNASAQKNVTAALPALPFLPTAPNATSAESFEAEEDHVDDDEELEDDHDDDDEFVDDDEDYLLDDDVPLMNLDPGSEYVLKVFEKLQKGNSMESATKELTTKLSHEHR